MSQPHRNRSTCPVPGPTRALLDKVSTYTMPAGTSLARCHSRHHRGDSMVPAGASSTPGRFSPLPGVAHAYLAGMSTAAILETAFRDVAPPARTVFLSDIEPWAVTDVTTRTPLELADLRDPSLGSMGLSRASLVAAGPVHYPCTLRWAEALHAEGHDGIIWHSRQADLHRAHVDTDGVGAQLLRHAAIEVTVIWSSLADPTPLESAGPLVRLGHNNGDILSLVVELSALLGIVVES